VAGSRCVAMETRDRVAGCDDRTRHPGQRPGDVVAHRRRRRFGATVERHRAYAQGTLVFRVARRSADRLDNPDVLAAARGVVRGTGLLATAGRQGQRAHRAQFAHQRPWWWYLPLVPVLLLPWLLTLRAPKGAWAGLWRGRFGRFVWCWWVVPLMAFCAISGKQIHYLLPLLP